MPISAANIYRFGPFEVNPAEGELLKEGRRVHLQDQPFRLLVVLLENAPHVVSREEIQARLWQNSAFGDFDSGLRVAVRKLREALEDDAESPRYIETVPKRGYRFLVAVAPAAIPASETADGDLQSPALPRARHRKRILGIAAFAFVAGGVGASLFWLVRPKAPVLTDKDTVILARFSNTTGDPVFDATLREGMVAQLEQSPFLSLLSDDSVQNTLRLMGQPPDAQLTPALARQICERTGSAAVLQGSIASLGKQYVVGLRATNCGTGDILDEEQAEASRKEDVLNALSEIARSFRSRVGESLASIKQHDAPLAQATTPSLEALKAYSMGQMVLSSNGSGAALPFFQRATQIDPQFAMAYAWLGRVYGDLGEAALSAQTTSRAYDLRDRASDREKFWIMAAYDTQVTENLEGARETCEMWERAYPRDVIPHGFLSGLIYPVFGQYEKAVEEAKRAIQIDPDFPIAYYLLADRYQRLGQYQEAANALQAASRRNLETPDLLLARYDIAFVRGDTTEMARAVDAARHDAQAQEWIANHRSSVLAYTGHLQEAANMSQQAAELAEQAGHREAAALYQAGAALWDGFSGDTAAARRGATAALKLSNDRGVEYGAALALAFSGDSARSQQLADDLERRFPQDTSVQFSYLPALRGRLALNRGEAAKAIELLRKSAPYELGTPRTAIHANFGALYPIYVRGEAYLAEHRGSQAANEFQKIVAHPGIVVSDPVGALARLQLARAYALSGDKARARSAYRDFFTIWKNADLDIPILKQARMEYKKLD